MCAVLKAFRSVHSAPQPLPSRLWTAWAIERAQGVAKLGHGLAVEARAPDGLVEAFRVLDSPAFSLAVQWHPEWKVAENPFYLAIFQAFGRACGERMLCRASHISLNRTGA